MLNDASEWYVYKGVSIGDVILLKDENGKSACLKETEYLKQYGVIYHLCKKHGELIDGEYREDIPYIGKLYVLKNDCRSYDIWQWRQL